MMAPKGEKHGCRSEPPNILSNLPENVIDDILICLPLRDAVRTSILSKKWRYSWCRLPELTLDHYLWANLVSIFLTFPTSLFAEIVCHLLTYHEGPITKFSLIVRHLESYRTIDNLIHFLSKKGIQHLVLQLYNYKLPSSFFTCSQMRYLTIENCLIYPPPAFKGFNRLISLELREVTICSKFLESFISYSPLLQYLVLQIPDIDSRVQIIAPNLKSLDCTGMAISLQDTPLLVKLSLVNMDLPVEHEECGLAKFFESFPALKHLHLDQFGLRSLVAGAGEVPKDFPSSLKRLYLSDISIGEGLVSDFLCLIRSSPCLQEIEIQVEDEDFSRWFGPVSSGVVSKILAAGSLELEGFVDVPLYHLRAVKVKGIIGTEPEMAVIKLLLAKSPVLVRMVIEPGQVTPELRLEILAELREFPQASPEAKVVYT